MNLKLQEGQISLQLPATVVERDVDRRQSKATAGVHEQSECDDALDSASGLLIALGWSVCMWLVVLAAVVIF